MVENTKRTFYKSFGLIIKSEILLPELCFLSNDEVKYDVTIEVSDLSESWLFGKTNGFIVNNNIVMFQIPNTAIFCIEGAKRIIVSPITGSDEDKIRLYILGTCMGILLMMKKTLTLHGSAIAINGKAYAVIGESGAGKSTLAAAFIRQGYSLLSDDVIPVSLSKEGIPYVLPSYPQQKLWKESLDQFGMDNSHYKPLFERETKFAIPVHTHFLNEKLPLAGVFELTKAECDNIVLKRVEGLERFRTIFNHTYRSMLIPRLGLSEWHFKETANLLRNINLFHLQRPINRFTVSNLQNLILNKIEGENIQYV